MFYWVSIPCQSKVQPISSATGDITSNLIGQLALQSKVQAGLPISSATGDITSNLIGQLALTTGRDKRVRLEVGVVLSGCG
jgi:glycerol kinase